MSSIIRVRGGLKSNLPTLKFREFGFCYDTKELFIGGFDGQNELVSAVIPFDTKGDLLVYDGEKNVKLPIGEAGQILTVDPTTDTGFKFAIVPFNSPQGDAGDILTYNGTDVTVLSIGTNGQVLVVDTSLPSKVKWVDFPEISGGGITALTQASDFPSSYEGQAGKFAIVKEDETGLEFGTPNEASTIIYTRELSVDTQTLFINTTYFDDLRAGKKLVVLFTGNLSGTENYLTIKPEVGNPDISTISVDFSGTFLGQGSNFGNLLYNVADMSPFSQWAFAELELLDNYLLVKTSFGGQYTTGWRSGHLVSRQTVTDPDNFDLIITAYTGTMLTGSKISIRRA